MGIRSLLGKKKKQNNNSMGDLSSTYETPPQSPSIFMNSSNKKVQEFEEIFKKFDVNGDGKIEWSELGLIMSSLGHNAEEEELKKMVKEVDSDGDGFIDLDEFIELNTIDPEKLLEDVKSAFTILDANGDGSISPQELQKVLRSLGESPTLEDCKNMIKGVDCDGDGLVSFEEFKKMMIRGSASTDHFLQRNASKNENQEVQQ